MSDTLHQLYEVKLDPHPHHANYRHTIIHIYVYFCDAGTDLLTLILPILKSAGIISLFIL